MKIDKRKKAFFIVLTYVVSLSLLLFASAFQLNLPLVFLIGFATIGTYKLLADIRRW